MAASGIEWTEKTWNPATGCTQVSAGCDNCYAMRLVNTRQVNNSRSPRYNHPFDEVMLHKNRLLQPTTWKKPTRVFVNSMSDVWHVDVPDAFRDAIFAVMESTPRHTFQVLTKRAERMMRYVNKRYANAACPSHIWLGVSIEGERVGWRADMLRRTNASVRWISAEPLLGSLQSVSLENIDWVVAGGESGRGARPMELDWARELRDRSVSSEIAFFFKQIGGEFRKRGKEEALLDGRRWTEYPSVRGREA